MLSQKHDQITIFAYWGRYSHPVRPKIDVLKHVTRWASHIFAQRLEYYSSGLSFSPSEPPACSASDPGAQWSFFWPSKGGTRQYIHICELFLHVCNVGLDLGVPRREYLFKTQSFMSNYASLSFNLFSFTRIASYCLISHTHNRDQK